LLSTSTQCSGEYNERYKNMIEAVIFDLDGTLLNTLSDIHRVVNRVLRKEGLAERTMEDVRMAVGRGVDHLVEELVGEEGLTGKHMVHIAERIRHVYSKEGFVETAPYPGVPELLSKLANVGLPMAVLSNKPHSSTVESVERFFRHIGFSSVRGAMKDQPIKPDPRCVKPVLRELASKPESTVMVGDSDVDMRTAVNSGMKAVGVTWGFRDEQLLIEKGADHIVNNSEELLTILENMGSV
jgi:phosphoglycolate phosphatase